MIEFCNFNPFSTTLWRRVVSISSCCFTKRHSSNSVRTVVFFEQAEGQEMFEA